MAAIGSEPLTIQHVLQWTFIVVLFVALLEMGLHQLIHVCKVHRKYYDMLNKVTGELMIVGLVYLIVKLAIYFNFIEYGGVEYYSLDAADMLLFFVALALVLQCLVIFSRLRNTNVQMDSMTITTASSLVQIVEEEMAKRKTAGCFARHKSASRTRKLLEHKILEAFFHDVHGLPKMFSFSKYLREVQDSQIVDLIEIDILGWLLLLLLLAGFFGCTNELQSHSLYRSSYNTELYQLSSNIDDRRKWVFAVFGGALMVLMIVLALFLKIMHSAVLKHAKHHFLSQRGGIANNLSKDDELLEALKCAALIENEEGELAPSVAMEQMRTVSESICTLENESRGCFKNLLAVQMVRACYRKVCKTRHQEQDHLDLMLKMPLPFSRRVIQLFLRAFLIVNGLFLSMLINCVVPTLNKTEMAYLGILQVPILINAFILAPSLVHKFSFLEATCRADPKQLSTVIDHIREVEELNEVMIHQIHTYLIDTQQTLNDIYLALNKIDENDGNADGYVDIEALRQTLIAFGFKLSRHKFHTLVLLKYKTKGTTVKFDEVLQTLEPRRNTVLASHESFQLLV